MTFRLRTITLPFAAVALLGSTLRLCAADETLVHLSIKDHKFEPAELVVSASKPFKIEVKNLDSSPEEVESKDLGFEKVIAGNGKGTIRLKSLKQGEYKFYGEYHEDTAKGRIIAK